MRRSFIIELITIGLIGLAAPDAGAQSSGTIAGLVRDSSGAVLPGVTVEASSPALIEKVRAAATDAAGQYKIIDLAPGAYTVTFALPGFSTIRRDGIALTTGFTATVDAELQIGGVAETITISGQASLVDVQNVNVQRVMTREIVDTLPTGRRSSNLATLIPGIGTVDSTAAGVDVGGSTGMGRQTLYIHGGRNTDTLQLLDGMPASDWIIGTAGNTTLFSPPDSAVEETTIQTGSQPADMPYGGVRVNWVPKSGGNQFSGTLFADFANHTLQGSNLDANLRKLGAPPGDINFIYEANGSLGGPIARDRIWFYGAVRKLESQKLSVFRPALNVNSWIYTPDLSKPFVPDQKKNWDTFARFTIQVSPRNKLSATVDVDHACNCTLTLGSNSNYEASRYSLENQTVGQLTWTSTLTNRLLIEAAGSVQRIHFDLYPEPGTVGPAATDLATGVPFRTAPGGNGSANPVNWWGPHEMFVRSSVSYVTGSHAVKMGGALWRGSSLDDFPSRIPGGFDYNVTLLSGVPRSVTYLTNPFHMDEYLSKGGVYAQDQWTVRRLTANLGVRLDTQHEWYPDQHLQATRLLPARDFPGADVVRWKDVSPRLGVAYNLFGNGKTALKASVNRYLLQQGFTYAANPALAANPLLTRTWTDSNGDYIPQGDPLNPAANGELGPSTNNNFGKQVFSSRRDPNWALGGFGVQPYNWEVMAGVQHEVLPQVSLNAEYFRRTYGNFTVSHNDAVTSADFSPYCITAPSDARLPNGGGQQICGLYDVVPAKVGSVDAVTTLASHYGTQTERWQGVDFSVNARLHSVLLQGGVSTGRTVTDNCDVVTNHHELLGPGVPLSYCHLASPYLTQLKLLGSYVLPWNLQVAATLQSGDVVGPQPQGGNAGFRMAPYTATSAVIAPSLGRNLASGANGTVNINLIPPGTVPGPRLHQLDLRFSRSFPLSGGARLRANIDLYNALNSNTVLRFNDTYGTNGTTWLNPLQVEPARFVKFGGQLTF